MTSRLRDEKGATLVFVAIVMLVLLGFAALAIDAGVLYTARAQCQNAADSGALACAGRAMSPTLTSGIIKQARLEGVQYANQNKVLSPPVAINLGDVTFDVNLKRCRVCVPRTQAR